LHFPPSLLFKERCREQASVKAGVLLRDLRRCTLYDVPKEAKLFIAPFVEQRCTVPNIDPQNWRWDFLSDERAEAAAKLCQSEAALVRAFQGIDVAPNFLQEAIVRCALLQDPELSPQCQLDSWEWARDPGAGVAAGHQMFSRGMQNVPAGFGPAANGRRQFHDRELRQDVKDLTTPATGR
jgi:hypothetical protein